MAHETEYIEYKQISTDKLYKEVIAFANTAGGVIYVGCDNEGNVTGLEDVDKDYLRITNGIRDSIVPDVTMFTKYTLQEDKVVKIEVQEGANKPYYLYKKGLKPTGVFVRQGTSSAPASAEQIRQLIKLSDGDVFETMRSIEQELTFEACQEMFAELGKEFDEPKYLSLGLTSPKDGLFTNLALLVSDQCKHTIKVAVFGDEANTQFKDRREFEGSIFAQLKDAYEYISLTNNNNSKIEGLMRYDNYDYPSATIREALLNALAHRDYGFSGSIIVNINEKEMEIISMGGLVEGIQEEDIRNGISQSRNKNLANLFLRLNLVESYGTGIRRIFALYKNCAVKPRIDITANSFKMVLPNMNYVGNLMETMMVNEPKEVYAATKGSEAKIVEFLKEKEQITFEDIKELLNVKDTRAYVIAKKLCDQQVIEAIGRGKNKVYVLCER